MYKRFENLVDPFRAGETKSAHPNVLSYLKSQLLPFRTLLPWLAIAASLKAGFECALIFYGGRLIDMMTATSPTAFMQIHWPEMVLAILAILIMRPAVIWLHHLLLDQAMSSNLQEHVKWQAHRYVLKHSLSYFSREQAGRLSNRVMQLSQAVEDIVHSSFEAIWFALVYVAIAIALLSNIDPRLGIPLTIWILAFLFYARTVTRRITRASKRWSSARSDFSGNMVDLYTNIETVKLYFDSQEKDKWALGGLKRLRLSGQRFRRELTKLSLGINILNGAMIVGVVGPAVYLWTIDHTTIGQVSAATALTIRLNGMTGWIMWTATRIFENVGVIREALPTISTAHDIKENTANAPKSSKLIQKDDGFKCIQLKNVTLAHELEHVRLRDVSLEINAGDSVGLCGPSGAGKSSVIKLLTRLIEPTSGQILLDGIPLQQIPQDELRKKFSVVPQDPTFFHTSVRNNLLLGIRHASDADMIAASKLTGAHDFIRTLRDAQGNTGYAAHIGTRGAQISGGQRQQLAITRAILRDAPILILDEATSAMDQALEKRMLERLENVLSSKTVISIAHRLHTLAGSDHIFYIEGGRISERGSYGSLIHSGGPFAKMVNASNQRQAH